jgi:hypothetical protein
VQVPVWMVFLLAFVICLQVSISELADPVMSLFLIWVFQGSGRKENESEYIRFICSFQNLHYSFSEKVVIFLICLFAK